MDLEKDLLFPDETEPGINGSVRSVAQSVDSSGSIRQRGKSKKTDVCPRICRAEDVTKYNVQAASIDDVQPPPRCVQSNLACLSGMAVAQFTTCPDGVIACDTHLNPNSSTASLTTCLPGKRGQTLHRHNLPATAGTLAPHRSTCRSIVITASREGTSCALHDQSTSTGDPARQPTCFRCLSVFNRSLLFFGETHPKALASAVSSPSQLDRQLRLQFQPMLSTLLWPPAQTLASALTNHIGEKFFCSDVNSELTSWIFHAAQFAKMYQTNCSDSQPRIFASYSPLLDSVNSGSFAAPIASQLYTVDKSMSTRQQETSNETKEDLNSICKYLPTSDQVDGRQQFVSTGGSASQVRYQVHMPLLHPPKTCRVPPPTGAVLVWWTQLLCFLMVICQLQPPVNASANIRAIEQKILSRIIEGDYDFRIRPSGNATGAGGRQVDGPAVVNVNLLIRSISRIDDVVMEYSVQVTFREQWVDNRLKFDDMNGQIRYLVLTDPNKVWRPDLFFKNEKEGHFHEIIMPNVLLRIYPGGDVLYSIRISLVLACPMDLKYYPLDKQICSIQMASYGYTTEDLMFVWKKENPVQITTDLHLPRFTLEKYLTDYCTSKTNTGSYSCLKVELLFKREFSYYLIQIYIPCCMLVIVSWVSFWLDPNAIPARVSLGVTTLLTMATSISGINSSLPPVSYTKAIDVWTGVCLTFVFGALLEFALVNYASRSDAHRAALKQQQAAFAAQRKWDLEHAALEADHIDERASAFAMRPLVRQHRDFGHGEKMRTCEIHVSLPKRNWCKRWLSKFPTRSKRIDVISRIFFPLMFALFNLVYWTTYLFREDMQKL